MVNPRIASVTTNPIDASTPTGTPVSFTAHATADPAATVQWYVSHDAGSTFAPTTEASATSDILTVTPSYADNGNLYEAKFTNGAGDTYSGTAALTVTPSTPTVTSQTSAVSTTAGATATFSVTPTGDPAPTSQWSVSTDGGDTFTDITGATDNDLSFASTYADDGNLYRDTLTNAGGAVVSDPIPLTVAASGPTVVQDPADATVATGSPATFAAAATGDPTASVQWQVSTDGGSAFADLTGETSGTLTVTPTYADNGNQYRAVFTNPGAAVHTTAATLTVQASSPTVANQTSSVSATAGDTATFSVTPSGDPVPTSQWSVSTDGGTTFTDITGATDNDLSFAPTYGDSGNVYRNTLTSIAGTVVSDPIPLTVAASTPVVVHDPADTTVATGSPATFTAAAKGDPTPSVQWQVSADGGRTFADLAGETSGSLTVTPTYAFNGNDYRAVFTSPGGTTSSAPAALTVQASGLTVTVNPTNHATLSGRQVTLSAAATGDPAPSVRWQRSADLGITFTDIAGATDPDYTFTATQSDDQSMYQAVFTSSGGTITTTAATLSVSTSIALLTQPRPVTVLEGRAATFTSAATGSPAPTVKWQVSTDNGASYADLHGATGSVLSVPAELAKDKNLYRAVWTNRTGSLASSAARLTVTPKPVPVTPQQRPTVQVAAGTVMFGDVTTVTGRATAGALVDIYGYTQPSTTYKKLATVRTSAKGVYTYKVLLHANSRMYAKVGTLRSTLTAAEHVRSTISLTATKVGSYRYVFSGTVGPHRGHQLVTLYYRIRYGQLVLATARTDSAGRFRIDRSLLAYGQHYYSVFAAVGTDGVTLGNTSPDRSIAVYRAR